MRRNPVYEVLVDLLDRHGIRHTVEFKGRHPSLRFIAGGRPQRITLPFSPSDRRAPLQARAFLRRILKGQVE